MPKILPTCADKPAVLVTASSETKRPEYRLTPSTTPVFSQVFSRHLTPWGAIRSSVSQFKGIFRAGSIPGSSTRSRPGRKAWPALFPFPTLLGDYLSHGSTRVGAASAIESIARRSWSSSGIGE